jgi:MFS family permease
MAGHHRIWPYALFVGSGFAALVLEAVFLRQLAWVVGTSAVAAALVVAAFMAGPALGAVVFGRPADRSARLLRLFGLLEFAAGCSGAGLASLLGPGAEALLVPLAAPRASSPSSFAPRPARRRSADSCSFTRPPRTRWPSSGAATTSTTRGRSA